MICDQCANAADFPHMVYCAACMKPSRMVGLERRVTAVHNHPNTPGERCSGSLEPPKTGHDICREHGGCTCHHKGPGNWYEVKAVAES